MKKKIVSSLLAMAMAFSATSALTANAADVSVKIGSQTVKAGADYSVDVDLSGVPAAGLSSIDFAISYDSSVIDVTDVKLGTIGETGTVAAEGELGDTVFDWYKADDQIVIVWASGMADSKYWVAKDGTFLTISGTVKSTAKPGDKSALEGVAVGRPAYPGGAANTKIVFSGVKSKTDITDYTAAFTNGAVIVADGETSGTTTSTTTGGNVVWGDVNEDGIVDVKDAVLLARYVGNDTNEGDVSDQGVKNADVKAGGGLTADDLTVLLQRVANILSDADLPK